MAEQNALPLHWPDRYHLDSFIVADCNRAAFSAIRDTETWRNAVLTIIGPAASGKTHLASIFTDQYKAFVISSPTDIENAIENDAKTIMLDNADRLLANDRAGQEKLFFLFNAVTSQKRHLLLTTTQPFAEWVILPDLLSRLQSVQTIQIDDPDEETVKTTYQKMFMDRGIILDNQTLTFLLYRSERNFAFVRSLVDKLDKLALADNKRLTRPYVGKILADLL
jgi:chromosomal replication initiation ATPase DnaA